MQQQVMRPIVRYASTPLSRGLATSAPRLAPKAKKAISASATKGRQGFNQKKKDPQSSGGGGSSTSITLRYSMSGNPPDLSEWPRLQPDKLRSEHVGKPTTFSKGTYEKLKLFGLPKKIEKELSSAGGPASVVRQATVDMAKRLNEAKHDSSKDARYILTGSRGSGKSLLLLQAVSHALESGWIVLYIPKATRWTDSSSHYIYDPTAQIFAQWEAAQSVLSTLLAANKDKLDSIKLSSSVELGQGRTVESGTSLSVLVQTGAKDDRVAVKTLDAVMDILSSQTQVPVLWAIDEVQTLFTTSKYRAPDYTPIEPYHLSTPRLALDFIAGRRSFSRGTVLTSLSLSDPTNLPSPELITALFLPSPTPVTPYTPIDSYHLAHASSGLQKIDIPFGMNAEEAAGLFELYAKKGWAPGTDQLFMESFVSSAGNPGELGRGLARTYLALAV